MKKNSYKNIQRILAIEYDRIEKAIADYPKAFCDGVAVAVYNDIYADEKEFYDYENYCAFVEKIKKTGIGFQINVSSTIGHGDGTFLGGKRTFPTMMDADGTVCKISACVRSEDFHAYLADLITRYAKLGPSVLWIDDDFRMAYHDPVTFGCFCPDCVAKFNEQHKTDYTRESLVYAIENDPSPNENSVRYAWQRFNADAMVYLGKIIADAAHAIDENIIIGYMTPNPSLTVYGQLDFDRLIAVSKNKKGEVWFRHGAGFYDDKHPYTVIRKNIDIGRLCAMTEREGVVNLTEEVTSPYTRRSKSKTMTILEAMMNIGIGGANGVLDEGIKPNLSEQLRPNALVSWMHEYRDYLATVRGLIDGKHQIGVLPYFPSNLWMHNDTGCPIHDMDDLGSTHFSTLFEIGIPFTFREKDADVILFCGKTVRAMEESKLKKWLGRGVFADGTAAKELNARLGEQTTGLTSFTPEMLLGAGTSEKFTAHALNGDYVGFKRYNIWANANAGAACFRATDAEVLSYGVNPYEEKEGIVGTTVKKTAEGGRIAVSSRGAWSGDIVSLAKTHQIKNVFDFLFGGKMPVRLETAHPVAQSVWENEEKTERILFLYNVGYDEAKDITLHFDGGYDTELLRMDGTWAWLNTGDKVSMPPLSPWTACVLRLQKNN